MRFLLALFLALWLASEASAQTTITVDIAKARLEWDWLQKTGGAVEKFNVKCGQSPGAYTKITTIADPAARSAPVKDIIAGSGNWFCTVNAENSFGVSPDASEIPFVAGAVPLAPSGTRVTAN